MVLLKVFNFFIIYSQTKLAEETDVMQIKEEKDLIEKVSQCMQVCLNYLLIIWFGV